VDSDDSDEYVYTLETPADTEHFQTTLRVGNSEIPFQIDTGSTANIINETFYKLLVDGNPTITLAK
jgi:predicted aspartyl protease